MATFGNFLWFILGGAIWALFTLILAGIFAITIIGLPIARACLEFAKLAAFPFGKAVIRDTELYGKNNVSGASKVVSVILNIIWFPIGLIMALAYFALAVSCFVTIIGIPFGIAYVRLGKFIFLPMGARVVSKEDAMRISQNKSVNKKCRQCGIIYSGSQPSCPKCNSSLYEETNQGINVTSSPSTSLDKNSGDIWICKKCGEGNSMASSSCKSCGEYK
jgi:uncharacterized membrane protein YccF (DUF307 family)